MRLSVTQPDLDRLGIVARRHHLAVALRTALLCRAVMTMGVGGRHALPSALDFDFARRLI